MYEFIVLGLVPGTHIQITFIAWTIVASGLAASLVLWQAHRLHVFRDSIIIMSLLRATLRTPNL